VLLFFCCSEDSNLLCFLQEPLLIAAAKGGNSQDCQSLLEFGADVNWKNSDGDTALLTACRRGHTETIALLLAFGADSNITGNDTLSPLHICARRGDVNSLDFLLSSNANTMLKTKDGHTALDIAKEKGHEQIYSKLMRSRSSLYLNSTAPLPRPVQVQPVSLPSVRSDLPLVTPLNTRNSSILASITNSNNDGQNSSRRRNSQSQNNSDSESKENDTDRLIQAFGNTLNGREKISNASAVAPKISSSSSSKTYSIAGQSTSSNINDESSVIALKKIIDAEKVTKNILEAKVKSSSTLLSHSYVFFCSWKYLRIKINN
jgi:ankyrin repeat protein